jgi:hypothetical protein
MGYGMKRNIHVYLYRLNGKPVYVGQAENVERRDRGHQKKTKRVPFDKFLQATGRENFTLEIIGSVHDVPRGKLINKLENEMMDLHGTYYPDSGRGYNFGRANGFEIRNLKQHDSWLMAVRAGIKRRSENPAFSESIVKALAHPKVRTKMSAGMKASHAKAEVKARHRVATAKPEYKIRIRASVRAALAKPEVKARHTEGMHLNMARPEYKTECSESSRRGHARRRRNNKPLLRRWRYKRGLCVSCGSRRHVPGLRVCQPCRNYYNEWNRKAKERKAA